MARTLKGVVVYWIIGCLLAGASLGAHEKRCQNDPDIPVADFLVGIAAWPAGITLAMINPKLSACKLAAPPPS